MGFFNVLKPHYQRTEERTDSGGYFWRVRDWEVIGTAKTMDEAKEKFGGPPWLEWVHA